MLHWAPLGHAGLRERMGAIAAWVTRHRPAAFYVDVSVEVAAAVRLMGVPVVVAAMPGSGSTGRTSSPTTWPAGSSPPGRRTSTAPATSSRTCTRPPSSGASPGSPVVRARPVPTARPSRRVPPAEPAGSAGPAGPRKVLLLAGAGTTGTLSAQMRAVSEAATAAGWESSMVGGPGTWSADHWQALCDHDVVVTHAGQGAVADVATADRPALLLPQERPFGEQTATAHALARAGMATLVATGDTDWHDALLRAAAAPTAWHRWGTDGAAARAAAVIEQAAGQRS